MSGIDVHAMTLPEPPKTPGLGVRDVALDAPLTTDALGRPLPETPGLFARPKPHPEVGSALGDAELAFVKAYNELATDQTRAAAILLQDVGEMELWFGYAKAHRARVGAVKGWKDTVLMGATMLVTAGRTQVGKHTYRRERPYQLDDTIRTLPKLPHDVKASYPSGHASSSAAAAAFMEHVDPERASTYRRATRLTQLSRMHVGVHNPSDTAMGMAIGVETAGWFTRAREGAARVVAAIR